MCQPANLKVTPERTLEIFIEDVSLLSSYPAIQLSIFLGGPYIIDLLADVPFVRSPNRTLRLRASTTPLIRSAPLIHPLATSRHPAPIGGR